MWGYAPHVIPSGRAGLKYIGVLFASKPAVQVCGNAIAGPMVGRFGAEWTLLAGLGVLALSDGAPPFPPLSAARAPNLFSVWTFQTPL